MKRYLSKFQGFLRGHGIQISPDGDFVRRSRVTFKICLRSLPEIYNNKSIIY